MRVLLPGILINKLRLFTVGLLFIIGTFEIKDHRNILNIYRIATDVNLQNQVTCAYYQYPQVIDSFMSVIVSQFNNHAFAIQLGLKKGLMFMIDKTHLSILTQYKITKTNWLLFHTKGRLATRLSLVEMSRLSQNMQCGCMT